MPFSFSETFPIIAILRGLTPDNAISVGQSIVEAGIHYLEVPLDTPYAIESVKILADRFSGKACIGAGTVLNVEQIQQVKMAGGEYVVSPNTDQHVIQITKENGLFSLPGCQTPTEAIQAINAGADALKLFPANVIEPMAVAATLQILPKKLPIFMVGGISTKAFEAYLRVGATGFGIGGQLFTTTKTMEEIAHSAKHIVNEFKNANERVKPAF